ncbi:hypothetical protein NC652_003984 [Populus alba x Populus x berolinensis]|nr:hypothetical protein NC652_003984 [Populus alba x Populus x berolinensis]
MVMLASSAGSLVLKRVKPVVMVASSGISFVLETGFGEKEADGCAALLGCSPFSASFSLVSYALPCVPHCFLFLAFPSPSVFSFLSRCFSFSVLLSSSSLSRLVLLFYFPVFFMSPLSLTLLLSPFCCAVLERL